MGIKGLLPLLSSIQKPTHLRNFAGQTLGIDAYGWLHRGTIACAVELAEGTPTRKHIDFALNRVRMLLHFGVRPYLVFDGDYLPSKAHTEKERAAKRRESKRLGLENLRMGRKSLAQLELQKAIDVTPMMARELIEELKLMGVPYVVAPYEADSQMAFLEKQGIISGVISEDSDLLVFGVQCLITKLDQYGEAVAIHRADFTACREISLVGWSDKEFRLMAMLSGCDYLPGIENIGLKTAYRVVRKHKKVENVIRALQFDGKTKVPPGYLDAFHRAENTFLYQWVFDPEEKSLLNLTKLPPHLDIANMPYIGKYVESEIAAGVAYGDLDPNTKLPIPPPPRALHLPRRSLTAQTPDGKPGKSIEEFFKPRRTPLAELDPNSFTPSPSQQRLLQMHENATWSESRVDGVTAPLRRQSSLSGSIRAPMSAPPIPRRTASQPWPTARDSSPKRQRLCSNPSIAQAMKGTPDLKSATSRFFDKQTPQASPSVRKKAKSKHDDEEFGLWSDDSIAEAVAAATSTQESLLDESRAASQPRASSPRKRKKIAIFQDSVLATTTTPDSGTSQSSTSTSKDSLDNDTPCTSFTSEDEFPAKALRARLAAFRADSAFESSQTLHSNETLPQNNVILNSSPPASPPPTALEPTDDSNNISDHPPQCIPHPFPSNANQGSEDLLVPESPTSDETDPHAETTPSSKLNLRRFTYTG